MAVDFGPVYRLRAVGSMRRGGARLKGVPKFSGNPRRDPERAKGEGPRAMQMDDGMGATP